MRRMIKKFSNSWEAILAESGERIIKAAGGNLDRDYIRTEPVTEALLESFGHKKPGPKNANVAIAGAAQ